MFFGEILAGRAATAIARAILALWLRETDLSFNKASSVNQIIAQKARDIAEQERASQQFIELGQKVAASLVPIFQLEAHSDPNFNNEAVANVVADALNSTDISIVRLIGQNLDATKLTQNILLQGEPYSRFLSASEVSLYQRIIRDVSIEIVEIISQLPSFDETAFAQILRRQIELSSSVDRILTEIEAIKEKTEIYQGDNYEVDIRSSMTKKLFAIMPFGERPAFSTHGVETIPFDKVYSQLIRVAGESTGYQVLRIDEISAAGLVSDQFLKEIFESDVVIADISLPNPNVFYELGIRQAISTGITILIALRGTDLPFDIQGQRILFYDLSDMGLYEARHLISEAINAQRPTSHDNPIRRKLGELGATADPKNSYQDFTQELRLRAEQARNSNQLIAVWHWAKHLPSIPSRTLFWFAEHLADLREWSTALDVIQVAIEARPNDYELYRQRGWYLRHLGKEFEQAALESLTKALDLNPNDPEALGMIGGLLKRQGKYREAAEYYAKGARIAPSNLYMRVTQAAMEVLSEPSEPLRGIESYRKLLENLNALPLEDRDEWIDVVKAEASFALGEDKNALDFFNQAFERITSINTIVSAIEQIEFLGAIGFRTKASEQIVNVIKRRIKQVNEGKSLEFTVPLVQRITDEELPIIIHLSDIHFGSVLKDGKRLQMHRFYDGDYSRLLSDYLKAEFASPRGHFRYKSDRLFLVISGDLVYTGTAEEYNEALTCLNAICAGIGINKDHVVITPGNHDINWHAAKADITHRFDEYIVFLEKFYGSELFHTLYPFINWNLRIDQKRPDPSDLISIRAFLDNRFILASLNSCVYETDQHHYGFVGGKQLRRIGETLAAMNVSNEAVAVAIMHHHLHPFPERIEKSSDEIWIDVSTIRDSGLVERNLEKLGFDVVLHGHKHKPQLRETIIRNNMSRERSAKNLIVCGAGSCGVSFHELEPGQSNQYQVLEFLKIPRAKRADFLRVEWRVIESATDADWRTYDYWTMEG